MFVKHDYFPYLFLVAVLCLGAANDGYRICRSAAPGCTAGSGIVAKNSGSEVSEWCTCKTISNTTVMDILVPTKTEDEYRSFLNNLPSGVTIGACATNGGIGDYYISGTANSTSIRGCDRMTGTIMGGGGGGGVRTSAIASAGDGGQGGRLTFNNSVLTLSTTATVTVLVGDGGQSGACQSGALGGTGGYDGGRGSLRNGTSAIANGGLSGGGNTTLGGLAGAENGVDQPAGSGMFGGGGGGGDANTNARNGGGGGGATAIRVDGADLAVAGGGGGGGGCRGNSAAQSGGDGGKACFNTVTGAGLTGGNDLGNSAAGPGGGGGGCLSTVGSATIAATGGTGGAPNLATCGSGTAGSSILIFSRTTSLP